VRVLGSQYREAKRYAMNMQDWSTIIGGFIGPQNQSP